MTNDKRLANFHLAIEKGKVNVVNKWLKEIDVNEEFEGMTAVQFAARRGNQDIYKAVFAAPGANLMINTNSNYSLLHLASERMDDDVELITFLLENGLDPNQKETKLDETPLMVALRRWRPKICKLLISHPSVDLRCLDCRKESPLYRAVQLGSVELVTMMLETQRVDLEQRNVANYTPVVAAVNPWGDADPDMASELRRIASKVEGGSRVELLQTLIAAGADLNVVDHRNRNILIHAALFGSADLIRCLLDAGCNPNTSLPQPVGFAIVEDDATHYEEFGVLIQHSSFDANHLYAGASVIDIIVNCAARNARLQFQSDRGYQGYRPIGGEFRYEVFIDRLVSLGCPFINSIKNNRLLVAAIELGRPRLVELFISNASNLNEPVEENTGNTALHVAVKKEMPEIARSLILGGASREARNREKLRPIDLLEFSSSRSEQLLDVFLNTPPFDDVTLFTLAALLDRCIKYSRNGATEQLLKHGAPLRCPGFPSPLFTWIVSVSEREVLPDRLDRHREIGRQLLAHPDAAVNRVTSRTGNEVVPIHSAISCGNTIFLRLLLDHGANICQTDSNNMDALSHVLRFEDRRVRLQMARVLVGRGFRLPSARSQLLAWLERHCTLLLSCPWSLFRLILTALVTSLVLPGLWPRMMHKARTLVQVARNEAHGPHGMPVASQAPQPNVITAIGKLDSMSRSLFLVDIARDAVRRQLVTVTKDRVLRLPLPTALQSHVLLETTFADMEKDELGVELETLDLHPTSDSVTGLGGVEDWPAIHFLSATRG